MRLFLNYYTPDGKVVWGTTPLSEDNQHFSTWVDVQVKYHEDFIFFFTTDSTDVF